MGRQADRMTKERGKERKRKESWRERERECVCVCVCASYPSRDIGVCLSCQKSHNLVLGVCCSYMQGSPTILWDTRISHSQIYFNV